MQKSIAAAAQGSQSATDALAELGLTVADLRGLSPDEQFKLIADRLSQIQSPALCAAIGDATVRPLRHPPAPDDEGRHAGIDALQSEPASSG